MRFVWFWTFWHWSKEGYREGSLLRDPLHGLAGHWDEWFRHEASSEDLRAIEELGSTEDLQRRFIGWIFRVWGPEGDPGGFRTNPLFVLKQLAPLPPFSRWTSFDRYRTSYLLGGVSAIILAEGSAGEASDVRQLEALALPAEADPTAPAVVSEGFQADPETLNSSRAAALSLLMGNGLFWFIALWLGVGRRPYPRWMRVLLGAGWLAVAVLIAGLILGPEPGHRLFVFAAILVGLAATLIMAGIATAAKHCLSAISVGKELGQRLERSQVRILMNGGLTLHGGSAGLAFAINSLLAIERTGPRAGSGSWLWRQFFSTLRRKRDSLAATGAMTPDGRVKEVVLGPKLRAGIQREEISEILTPCQRGANAQALARGLNGSNSASRALKSTPRPLEMGRIGFAAEPKRLRVRRCRHIGQAAFHLSGLRSWGQLAMNILAMAATSVMLAALPDLKEILHPPPAPLVVPPASLSPGYLWISLATSDPQYFTVALESRTWLNRRAEVARHGGANASIRAEIRLQKLSRPIPVNDDDDGIVWVERRHRFLGREFLPDERVGRYSLDYLRRLGNE
jgi:hypothetical protein